MAFQVGPFFFEREPEGFMLYLRENGEEHGAVLFDVQVKGQQFDDFLEFFDAVLVSDLDEMVIGEDEEAETEEEESSEEHINEFLTSEQRQQLLDAETSDEGD